MQPGVQVRFELSDAAPVQHARFYVHEIVLLDANGGTHSFEVIDRTPWQGKGVALLDLAADQASPRSTIEGKVKRQRYTGIRFTVGVPFDLNHANPLTAAPPLDRADMFWSWQSGYKFLRLDLSAAEHEAAFHLGSTGCSSASALRPPRQPCVQPNAMRIELTGFDPTEQAIQVQTREIVAALEGAELRACTGDYATPACAAAFAVTGLNVQSGTCAIADAEAATADSGAQATAAADARACALQRLFAGPP